MLIALLAGLALGFLGSVPVAGPIAVIVVDSALENRPREGFHTAVGAAVAESLYAMVAFWGLTTVFARYPLLVPITGILGGAILVGVGVFLLRRRADPRRNSLGDHRGKERPQQRGRRWLFGFTITILNPTLVATWTAAVAALHTAFHFRYAAVDALPFAAGVSAGIVGWFWLLLKLVRRFKVLLEPKTVDRLIRGMGGALVLLGFVLAGRTFLATH